MIKNKLILIFITMFLITFSCKKKTKEIDYEKKFNNTDDFEVISVDINKEEESINISDFIDNVSYIKLETNRNCIIGKIDKIEITENYIYILDRFSTKSLFVFKKNGDFFKKIGRIGNGPGEYSSIWDFCILNDKELFIHDFSQNKLLFYKDFEFHKQIKNNTFIESIIKNDSFYYSKPYKDVSLKVPDLIVQNSELKIVREEYYAPPFTKNSTSYNYNFRFYKDSVTFIRHFENKVYRIKDNKVTPKYFFDFGKHKITYSKAYSPNGKLSDDSNTSLFDDFYETEKYIYLTFGFNGNVFSALYDKNTKTLKHSKYLSTNYKQIAGKFVNSNATSIFGFVETNDLERLDTKIKEKYNLFDIKEFDNPIITISHLK